MSKSNRTLKIKDLLYNTNYIPKSHNNNLLFNQNDTSLSKNDFPPLFKSYSNKYYCNKFTNNFSNKNMKSTQMNQINKTFYSIKRQVHHLMPRTKSLIYKSHKNFEFKNIFHSDTFEKIRNKVYNNELNEEFNHEKGNYNMLLYNLIKKNKNSKIGEINIKYNFINKINKNLLKKKNEKQKNNTYKMLKLYKSYNYTNFKKNIGITLEKKDVIDKKIKEILDNVEAKFDNIFIDVMDKKYNLDQINQFKENNNIY
jgi:hypothetical protein